MKRKLLTTVLSASLAASVLLTPVQAASAAATPTAGISAALGNALEKNVRATVASTELMRSAVGELVDTESVEEPASTEPESAAESEAPGDAEAGTVSMQEAAAETVIETEPGTEFENILSEMAEEPVESSESIRAGVIGDLDMMIAAEVATEEAPEETPAEEATAEEVEPEVIAGYTNLALANVEGNLNIRATAGEDGELAGKLPADAAAEILSVEGDWTLIRSGEVEGYVKSEYLLTGDAAKQRAQDLLTLTATSLTSGLNVRELPNTDSEVVDQMAEGEEITVLEELGDWIKVDVDGEERYVSAEYVTVEEKLRDALTLSEARYGEGVSDVRVAVVDFATQYVGNPYVWGGTSLTNGADCSGFVMSVMANYGVGLPHSSAAQANCGTRVGLDELMPGDLIFYGSGKRIGHVAIYIGNGQICHASNKRTGITISNMYYRSPICATRVLN